MRTDCTCTNKDCRYYCGGGLRLHPLALGLAFGLTAALLMFVMGLLAAFTGTGLVAVQRMGEIYVGYGPTFLGSLIGAGLGFLESFIFGVIVAWLYNCFACKTCKKEKVDETVPPTQTPLT